MKLLLEVSLVNHPSMVLDYGEVPSVPAIGDFVQTVHKNVNGYVEQRRWKLDEQIDDTMRVRVWLR